jgi:hypothetical protein
MSWLCEPPRSSYFPDFDTASEKNPERGRTIRLSLL